MIDIDDNIKVINENIEQLKQELLRLEGSLRVFHSLKQAGVTKIPVKQENLIMNTKEVVEHVQGEGCSGQGTD